MILESGEVGLKQVLKKWRVFGWKWWRSACGLLENRDQRHKSVLEHGLWSTLTRKESCGRRNLKSMLGSDYQPQFSSVAQSCPTLCHPINCSTPGLPVYHQLPEFTQTQVHWVSDAIQPSHPLLSPSLAAPNPSQHQGLFQWVNSLHEVAGIGVSASASVLPMNTQDWSPLEWTGGISLQSKKLSRVFSNTTVQKHQFFGAQLSSQPNSHIHTWPQEKP